MQITALQKSKILVIDDMEFNRFLIQKILEKYGFTEVVTASNGREGLEKTHELEPDIVVLDLMMPEMDGFEYCRALRADSNFSETPILVQTALNHPEQRAQAFSAGATDFILKPVDADELIARLRIHLERQKLLEEARFTQERIKAELNSARAMQHLLMPQPAALKELAGQYAIEIHSHFESSSELGGDFWGMNRISPEKLAFYTVDFSGHGVKAALNTFRLHTLLQQYPELADDPGSYLTAINNSIFQLLNRGDFATMFYGVLDIKEDMLSFAVAGPPPPIMIAGNRITWIDGSGFPLGIQNRKHYHTQQTPFLEGSLLLLYSDALIETPDSQGKTWEESALQAELSSAVSNGHRAPVALIRKLLYRFDARYRYQLQDDLTLLAIGR